METTQNPREAARHRAHEMLRDNARSTAEDNAAAEARMSGSTPTPTQEENDLAKMGQLDIDTKQDDGSGPEENPWLRRVPRRAYAEQRRREEQRREEQQPARRTTAPTSPTTSGGSAA